MALKFSVSNLGEVPAAQRTLYKESNGKYVLDVEGAASADDINALTQKANEFSENNVRLMKDAERFKDVDPDEYRQLLAKAGDVSKKETEFDTKLKAAVEAAVAPLKQELDTASKGKAVLT